ncbi:isocitrate dehydrogenase kinase/phosphatase-domain containing protein [Vogesella mureinivorans]|uniref:isocitrate dehydrogenase kinase/phosphatase-domain containing protein n=1 Tax=Vogesella mureinivorans TaxID=657276 RepID=UPI0011C7BFE9
MRHLQLAWRWLLASLCTTQQMMQPAIGAEAPPASARTFPLGMLFKNFAVKCPGWLIFYGYDEIEYMTDCQCACIGMTDHLARPR